MTYAGSIPKLEDTAKGEKQHRVLESHAMYHYQTPIPATEIALEPDCNLKVKIPKETSALNKSKIF